MDNLTLEEYIKNPRKIIHPSFTSYEAQKYIETLNIQTPLAKKIEPRKLFNAQCANFGMERRGVFMALESTDIKIFMSAKSKFTSKAQASNPANYRPVCNCDPKLKSCERTISRYYGSFFSYDHEVQYIGNIFKAVRNVITMADKVREGDGVLLFVDVANAYGSVNYELMADMITNDELREYFKQFYGKLHVTYDEESQEPIKFQWTNGLLQGMPMSTMFFIIYMDYVIAELKVHFPDIIVYVDDFVFHIKNYDTGKLQLIVDIFKSFNLKINLQKSKIFNGQVLHDIDEPMNVFTKPFMYLGHPIFTIKELVQKLTLELTAIENMEALKEYLLHSNRMKKYKMLVTMDLYQNYIPGIVDAIVDRIITFDPKRNKKNTKSNVHDLIHGEKHSARFFNIAY